VTYVGYDTGSATLAPIVGSPLSLTVEWIFLFQTTVCAPADGYVTMSTLAGVTIPNA